MRIVSSVHDLHHGGIPREVGAQHPSLYHAPVGKDHTHDFIAAHDVGRRQNQALRRDNDAAARLSPSETRATVAAVTLEATSCTCFCKSAMEETFPARLAP